MTLQGLKSLVRVQCTKLLGGKKVALGVVGGLYVSYLHQGGLEGTLPSEDGMVGAPGA